MWSRSGYINVTVFHSSVSREILLWLSFSALTHLAFCFIQLMNFTDREKGVNNNNVHLFNVQQTIYYKILFDDRNSNDGSISLVELFHKVLLLQDDIQIISLIKMES